MEFTVIEKAQIVKFYFANNDSAVRAQREWRRRNGGPQCNRVPLAATIRSWANKFLQTGSLKPVTRQQYQRNARSEDQIEEVSILNIENRSLGLRSSVRSLARDTGISKSTVHRILRQDILLKPYRPAFLQKLTAANVEKRYERCLFFLDHGYTTSPILDNIIFSDEAYFSVNGFICGQNWRYWGLDRDDIGDERRCFKELHPANVLIWVGVCINLGIIGPFFISENLNAAAYLTLLQDHIVPTIQRRCNEKNIAFGDLKYQQDGATPHTANVTMQYLRQCGFSEIIGDRQGSWPSHSPDLAPNDFWFWGHLKEEVYNRRTVFSLKTLKQRIVESCLTIGKSGVLESAIHCFADRVGHCLMVNGGHFEHLL